MTARTSNVLFLCTGNSARSILAEALLNAIGKGRFRAYSAGSAPTGAVHPLALEILRENGLPTEGLRSKSWSELLAPRAPAMDFVFTVCASAEQACPLWPGHPFKAHWAIEDPAAAGTRQAFAHAFGLLRDRLLVFASLPVRRLARDVVQRRLDELAQLGTASSAATDLADRIHSAARPLRGLGGRRVDAEEVPRVPLAQAGDR